MPQNRHNFEGRGIQNNTLNTAMFHVPRLDAQGTKLYQKNRNVLCVVKLTHTKTVQTKKKEPQNVQTVENIMPPTTEAVLRTRVKLSGKM